MSGIKKQYYKKKTDIIIGSYSCIVLMVTAFFFSFKAAQKLKELIVCTTTVAGTQGMWLWTSKVGPVLDQCFQWQNNSANVPQWCQGLNTSESSNDLSFPHAWVSKNLWVLLPQIRELCPTRNLSHWGKLFLVYEVQPLKAKYILMKIKERKVSLVFLLV